MGEWESGRGVGVDEDIAYGVWRFSFFGQLRVRNAWCRYIYGARS